MTRRRIGIAAALVAATIVAAPAAADERPASDPIDTMLDECLARLENQTTSGMLDCATAAHEAYAKELEAVYERVMTKLDPRSRALVHAAQREWLAYRETERKAMRGPWIHDRGSLVILDIAAADIEAVKARIRELTVYE